MYELPVDPALGIPSIYSFLFYNPFDILAQACNHFVLFVEERDASVQLRDEQEVFPCVEIGGHPVTGNGFEVFALHV